MRARPWRAATSIAWYPCWLALAWTLAFITPRDADPTGAVRSLAVAAAASVAITVVLRLVVRSTPIAGALACLVVLALLVADSALTLVLVVVAAALVVAVDRVERRMGTIRLPWPRIHEFLTVAAAALLVVQGAIYGAAIASRPAPTVDAAWAAGSTPAGPLPNVYVVIADGHGRADVLRDALGYDASAFIDGLERLGFDVSTGAHANYLFTHLSLPSFLAGAHVEELGADLAAGPDSRLLSATTRRSPALARLRDMGYRIVSLPSGFDHLGERGADAIDLDTGQLSELEYRLLQTTAIGSALAQPLDAAWLAAGRARTTESLQRLEALADDPDPRPLVALVHLPMPHPPYSVDASCRPLPFERALVEDVARRGPASQEVVALAAGQVACIDRLLTASLASVVASDPGAIVILMSDHGPDERLDWSNLVQPGLADRAAILFAARTPGASRLFPDDVSLVNVLPRLFNSYFGTSLALRPDSVYAAPDPGTPSLDLVAAP